MVELVHVNVQYFTMGWMSFGAFDLGERVFGQLFSYLCTAVLYASTILKGLEELLLQIA